MVSRPKAWYEITRAESGELLSKHRTRQAAIDNWRSYTGVAVRIWRRPRLGDESTRKLIVEGTWHESVRGN
jgi:hypothetical protein